MNLTKREKILVYIASLLLICYVGYIKYYLPIHSQRVHMEQKLSEYVDSLEEPLEIPRRPSLAEIEQMILTYLEECHIHPMETNIVEVPFRLEESYKTSHYEVMKASVRIKAVGTWEDFQILLNQIEEAEQIVIYSYYLEMEDKRIESRLVEESMNYQIHMQIDCYTVGRGKVDERTKS